MKTITIKLYEFGELSADVRKGIVEKKCFDVMDDVMDSAADEYENSLASFERATGFNVREWRVSYGTHSFVRDTVNDGMGDYRYPVFARDVKGKLLWRWCYHFILTNRRGKYRGKLVRCKKDKEHPAGYEHIYRRSKVIMEPITGGWCPWTGVVTDCPLNEPIVDFYLNYHRGKFSDNYSLEDLIDVCLEKFFSEWESEYNAFGDNKNGCVEEVLTLRYDGYFFFADGTPYTGDTEQLKTA